ncbi:MAG: oxidoreductase [Taibaiella sp.]|nr:oxidoreductase [Taibaiella sp.]
MLQPWQKGIVTRIEAATPNTNRYWIELPETPDFDFKAGQFVTLDLPIHEQRNKRWRSYSIASAPGGGNVIELVILHVDHGQGSHYIFTEVKEGSELMLRGPQGVFVLPPTLDEDLFLICTGTGIAPFRSMAHHIHNNNIAHKQINIIFGTRTRQDLLYADEMQALAETMPGFNFVPTLSREQWEGHNGYVHPVYEALCENRQPAKFMLCGWREMIDEAKQRILNMGYSSKDIHIEIYG